MANKKRKKTIALWGYSRYGKALLKRIQAYWRARYCVIAVFDSSVNEGEEKLLEGGIPLMNPSKALEKYQQGAFEAIVISVVNDHQYKEIERIVQSLEIPITTLIARDELCPMESFASVSEHDLPYGFKVHEYESVNGFYVPLYSWETHLFLFDDDGHGLLDNWFTDSFWVDATAFNPAFPFDSNVAPSVDLLGEYCAVSRTWGMNYWHFTYQFLDQIALMERIGFKGTYLLPHAPFAIELLGLANIGNDRVLWLDDLDDTMLYRFEKVLVLSQENYCFEQSAPLLIDIANTIRGNAVKLSDNNTSYPSRLFVKRVSSRRLLGVEDLLDAYGFQTIVPEDLTVTKQILYFMHADIVLSPHGANSTNSLFMRPGAVLIETFGRGWVTPCCVETLYLSGVHYLPVVETPIYNGLNVSPHADYKVRRSALEMAIKSAIQLVGEEVIRDACKMP